MGERGKGVPVKLDGLQAAPGLFVGNPLEFWHVSARPLLKVCSSPIHLSEQWGTEANRTVSLTEVT